MFGEALVVIAQVALLVLYYGNAHLLGITWAALPWWVVWSPVLLTLGVFVGLVVLVIILGIVACLCG